MNLSEALEGRAEREGWGDRPALVDGGSLITHHEVHDAAARMASVLGFLGLGQGDVVLLALADGADFAVAFLGAVRLGALVVPVNPHLPADGHRALAEDCGASLAICSNELADRFVGRCAVLHATSLTSCLDGLAGVPAVPTAGDAPAYAQYTSGTTGRPRAAVHRHGDPLVYAEAFAGPGLRLGPDDVVLSVSKMFFAYGLGNSLFFPLLTGACAVLHPGRPRPDDIVALVAAHRVSVLFAVPTFYANLLRAEPPGSSLASLRVGVSAGERLTEGLAERTAAALGCPVLDSLGTTEVGQAFVAGTLADASRAGAVGRPLPPYEIAVRDEAGGDTRPGTVGTLWVKGPTVLVEYLGQPEATAEAVTAGWLRTGDLVTVDEDGWVFHHGRADDMEMVGGITVAPQEIEELLSLHADVSEVAVAALADRDGATRLHAFVVPGPGAAVGEQLAVEIIDLARRQLAAHKVPRSVTFVDGLPRTATGKLRRFVLRSGSGWPAGRHVA